MPLSIKSNPPKNGLWKTKFALSELSGQSPDLNSTDMFWTDFERAVHIQLPTNVSELRIYVKRNGEKFILRRLLSKMPKPLQFLSMWRRSSWTPSFLWMTELLTVSKKESRTSNQPIKIWIGGKQLHWNLKERTLFFCISANRSLFSMIIQKKRKEIKKSTWFI